MSKEFEERYIKPIINASYPGTLAALNLTALQVAIGATWAIKFFLSFGSMMFILSSFSIFFYTIYQTRKNLWTTTAITFLLGLVCSLISIIVILLL